MKNVTTWTYDRKTGAHAFRVGGVVWGMITRHREWPNWPAPPEGVMRYRIRTPCPAYAYSHSTLGCAKTEMRRAHTRFLKMLSELKTVQSDPRRR